MENNANRMLNETCEDALVTFQITLAVRNAAMKSPLFPKKGFILFFGKRIEIRGQRGGFNSNYKHPTIGPTVQCT